MLLWIGKLDTSSTIDPTTDIPLSCRITQYLLQLLKSQPILTLPPQSGKNISCIKIILMIFLIITFTNNSNNLIRSFITITRYTLMIHPIIFVLLCRNRRFFTFSHIMFWVDMIEIEITFCVYHFEGCIVIGFIYVFFVISFIIN